MKPIINGVEYDNYDHDDGILTGEEKKRVIEKLRGCADMFEKGGAFLVHYSFGYVYPVPGELHPQQNFTAYIQYVNSPIAMKFEWSANGRQETI